jgi:hypothetical protein
VNEEHFAVDAQRGMVAIKMHGTTGHACSSARGDACREYRYPSAKCEVVVAEEIGQRRSDTNNLSEEGSMVIFTRNAQNGQLRLSVFKGLL